jgi:hypothetical protein
MLGGKMYSYEIVFSYPDLSFGSIEEQVKKNALQYKQTSEFIVAEKDTDALDYTLERCKIPDYEFVACIRRNPIIKIIQSAVLQQPTNGSAAPGASAPSCQDVPPDWINDGSGPPRTA